MSQAKVDRYKQEKKNRDKIIKKEKRQLAAMKAGVSVVAIALVISCLCRYTALVQWITPGFAIILSTMAAAAVGAAVFPLSEEEVTA